MVEDAKRLLFVWLAMLASGVVVLIVLYVVAIIVLGFFWGWLADPGSGLND